MESVRIIFQDLLSNIPKIGNESYESLVREGDIDENEFKAFESAVIAISSETMWGASDLLNKWISSEAASAVSGENIWEEIAQDITGHQNPFHAIIAMIHVAQLPKNIDLNTSQAAAAATLYLVLQRCPGARSRGLTNSITFHHTLKVLSYLTEYSSKKDYVVHEGDGEEDTEMHEPSFDSRKRSHITRTVHSSKPSQHCASRLLTELDASLKYLPLVVNGDSETLSSTVEVLICSLSCTEIPSLSATASVTLHHIALLSEKDAEMLVFKGIMPLFLGEKRKSGSSLASSGKSSRNAGMMVVNRLLDSMATNSSPTLAGSLLVLLEHLCHKAPEKAELRVTVVEAVDAILRRLPPQQQDHFTAFVSKFSRSSRVNHRIFAVDLVAELLKGSWVWRLINGPSSPSLSENDKMASTSHKLLSVIVSRGSDKAPTVRARSLGALAALAGAASSHEEKVSFVHAFLHYAATSSTLPSTSSSALLTPSMQGEQQVDIAVLLRRRLSDERAMVRRSAAQAVASFISLNLTARDSVIQSETSDEAVAQCWKDEIQALIGLCGDVSVATRKAAATSLASLRSILPRSAMLRHAFVGAILPLAHDAEASLQLRCGDLVKDAVLDPLVEWGKLVANRSKEADWTSSECDPSGVWFLLAGARSSEAQQCLQSLFWPIHMRAPEVSFTHPGNFLCGASALNSIFMGVRQGALFGLTNSGEDEDDEHRMYDDDFEMKRLQRLVVRQGAWVLLEALLCPNIQGHSVKAASQNASNVEASFVISCWRSLWQEIETTRNIQDLEMEAQRILRVLSHLAPSVPAQDATALAAELLALLQNFEVTASTAADMLRALMSLCTAKAPTLEAGAGMCAACGASLLENARDVLKSYVFPDGEAPNFALVERALFVVGEIGLLAFSPDDNGLAGNGRPVLQVDISPEILSLLRVLLGHTLPLTKELEDGVVPDSVRAFAYVALGKVCLVDQGMAKECVTLLVREIDETSDEASSAAVRSNALLVLGDLCVRYTSLVERHLPALAKCLQSKHALMRRHALLLLSQLLLQDFLKWRGLMLHRFLLCCVDEDAEVCQLATYLVTGPLSQKQPTLLSHAPLELLFILNGYTDHPRYQSALYQGSDGCGSTAVSFEDVPPLSINKRSRFLRFVCGALNDEQRIETTARVAQEVLAAADMSFAPESLGFSVLRDALVLLSSPEIKVGSGGSGEAVTEEEMVTAAANGHVASVVTHSIENAKKKLLSKMSKKQLMEHVVPLVLDLKAQLESLRSPLLKDLMAFLMDLLKTYRVEARAVLSVTDPLLAKELEYDLKNIEKQQRRQRQVATSAMASTGRSPTNTVGFNSPQASSSSTSLVKSLKQHSTKKGFPTPKLRGEAETPRTERTPRAAISSALGKQTPQSSAMSDYSLSTAGLKRLNVDDRATTLHLESKQHRVWEVSVTDKEPSQWSPESNSGEAMNTSDGENRSPVVHPPSPANKKKSKKDHINPIPLKTKSINKPVSDSLSSLSFSSSSTTSVGDSLASMRPPNHRTPNEGKKKKRIAPIS